MPVYPSGPGLGVFLAHYAKGMSDRAKVHVTTVAGHGPTIAFLHGLYGQGKNFLSVAKALAPTYGSALIDLPNHGESAWTKSVDYVDMADTVAATLRERVGRTSVIGHSMGGKVAMVIALRHPDLVERLGVVDIAPVEHADMSEFRHYLDSLAAIDLDQVATRADADTTLASMVPNATIRGFLLQNLIRSSSGFTWKANLDVLRRDLVNIGSFPQHLASYDGPVLWVSGGKSNYVRAEYGERMREYFPAVRKVVVKGAGHWVHSEQRDTFIATLRYFMEHTAPHVERT